MKDSGCVQEAGGMNKTIGKDLKIFYGAVRYNIINIIINIDNDVTQCVCLFVFVAGGTYISLDKNKDLYRDWCLSKTTLSLS